MGPEMADDRSEKSLGVRSPEPAVEVARETEERRRVAEIAREIEELGRSLDERARLVRFNAEKRTRSSHAQVRQPTSGITERSISPEIETLGTVPAIAQQRKATAEDGRPTRHRRWWPSLTAVVILLILVSAGVLKPTDGWIEIAREAYRSAVTEMQRITVRENAETEAAAPNGFKEKVMAWEAGPKSAEHSAATISARPREEEIRQATEKKAKAEAAREMAQAEARAAAQEAERKAAEEERTAAARRREEENKQATEATARAEAAREMPQGQPRAAAQVGGIRPTAEDVRLKAGEAPGKATDEKPKSDAEVREHAERAEVDLKLSEQDRKRVQVALNALGHSIPTPTGYFGPRTRAMIRAWQKTQELPETGYLTEAQLATLRQQAAAALAKYDHAQRPR
jgi:hypothetical protein